MDGGTTGQGDVDRRRTRRVAQEPEPVDADPEEFDAELEDPEEPEDPEDPDDEDPEELESAADEPEEDDVDEAEVDDEDFVEDRESVR